MAKASHVGKETALASLLTVTVQTKPADARKENAELCQDKVGEFVNISCSQESLSDMLGL